MVMKEKLHKAMNEQVNAEMHSAYIYLSMASWFESENLKGMAQWMKTQATEEMKHAMKFFHFINERRQKVDLLAIEGPQTSWKSPLDVFEHAFHHEEYITGRIHKLMEMAVEMADYAAIEFLQWFVKEQVEEEASADEVVQKLKMVGDSKNGLFIMDKELGKRGGDDD